MHCQTVALQIYCIARLLDCTYNVLLDCGIAQRIALPDCWIVHILHCQIVGLHNALHCQIVGLHVYCIARLLLNTSHCHELDCSGARWIAGLVHFAIVVILHFCDCGYLAFLPSLHYYAFCKKESFILTQFF